MPPKRETDLYAPVRDYLVAQGFTVQGEVAGCDVTAVRAQEPGSPGEPSLVVVELKRHLSVDLLAQAVQRQALTDSVYLAVPRPSGRRQRGRWKRTLALLRRLELGLMLVSTDSEGATVEVVCHPLPHSRRRSRARRRAIIGEMQGRSGDHNLGGSTGRKLMTAYREEVLRTAMALATEGECTPRRLRELGCGAKTQSILYRNHYGWFERLGHGLYRLSEEGWHALEQHRDVLDAHAGRQANGSSGS
ncbi:MAG: hypothetical protein HPY83_06800 [Anaerolineae bacterium]|nr:hypothetical protein [Anaerolineae bacterium]